MATLAVYNPAHDVIGSIRTFGPYGPMYDVTAFAPDSPEGERMMSIEVFLSGETLDYELEAVLADPLRP